LSNWAFISGEINQRLPNGEWKSGNVCWLMDFVVHLALTSQEGIGIFFKKLRNSPLSEKTIPRNEK